MMLLRCVSLLLSLCLLLLSACGAGGPGSHGDKTGVAQRQPAPDAAALQPGLPLRDAPAGLLSGLPPLASLRSASTPLMNNFISGAETTSVSSMGATTDSLGLHLDSAAGELAWGTYVLDITPQTTQRWVNLQLTYPDGTPDDEPVWIALGDFAAGRWELHDVRNEGAAYDLGFPRYMSAAQTLAIALLAWDGGTVSCGGLYLTGNEGNNPPVAVLQADFTSGASPLSVNFDASGSSDVDGNIASFAWDYDGDGISDETTTQPLASHVYNGTGSFNATVTVTDVYGEQDSNQVTIFINAGNLSPTAGILVLPGTVDIAEAVTLDGSASDDPDGLIVNYEWDTDGNGSFETDTGTSSMVSGFSFSSGGVRTLSMRVTDDDGATDTMSAPVTVRGWSGLIEVVSQPPYSFPKCSLAMINGRPAVTYRSNANTQRYVRAADEFGASWGNSVRVSNNSNFVFGFNSLAEIDGRPAVVFGNAQTEKLRYCRALDAEGAAWPDPQTVAEDVFGPRPLLLELEGGLPGIAWVDLNAAAVDMFFSSALNADGTSWSSPELLANVEGESFQAGLIGGNPALVFSDGANGKGFYLRADDALGGSWLAQQNWFLPHPTRTCTCSSGLRWRPARGARPAQRPPGTGPSMQPG